ncbi:MAG: hypothetical protein ACXWQO_06195 [Bdellovibrionota bacterium]
MKILLALALAMGFGSVAANADYSAVARHHHHRGGAYVCHEGQEQYYEVRSPYSGELEQVLFICVGGRFIPKY